MSDGVEQIERAGWFRWMTVGALSYLSWIVANLCILALFPLFVCVDLLGGAAGQRLLRRFVVGFLRGFFMRYLPLIGVYRFAELPRDDQLSGLRACLLVANHRSWLDALFMICLVPDVVLPVNASYMRVPLMGRMMRWLGCVPLDRTSRVSLVQGITEIRRALEQGAVVVGFPEGRRTRRLEIKPFADVLFRLAIETECAIAPVVLAADLPYLTPEKGTLLTPRPANWTIRLLGAITPERGERGADLGRRVRRVMSRELKQLSL